MTDLFHASTRVFEPGRVVQLDESSDFWASLDDLGRETCEVIDGCRPGNAPLRSVTLYSCESLHACRAFVDAEPRYRGQAPIYYRVSMKDPIRAPMALVDAVKRHVVADRSKAEIIAKAYWTAHTQDRPDWRYWEVVAAEMVIIEQVPLAPLPHEKLDPWEHYARDRQRTRALWG